MIHYYSTYAVIVKWLTHRIDADHSISLVIYKNYKGVIDVFYVNHKDPKQVKAFRDFLKSGKQMKIELGCYYRKSNKCYLMNVEDKQFNFNEG